MEIIFIEELESRSVVQLLHPARDRRFSVALDCGICILAGKEADTAMVQDLRYSSGLPLSLNSHVEAN
jgi:hypothetical protein